MTYRQNQAVLGLVSRLGFAIYVIVGLYFGLKLAANGLGTTGFFVAFGSPIVLFTAAMQAMLSR